MNVTFTALHNIVNYYYNCVNVEVLDEHGNAEILLIEFVAEEELGRLEVFIDLGEGYKRYPVYTYTTAGMTFTSDTGEDAAWRRGTDYKVEQEIITEQDAELI